MGLLTSPTYASITRRSEKTGSDSKCALQGLDEEGLRAYSGHLQQEFLRPDVTSAKRPSRTDDAEDDDDDAEEDNKDAGPAPEDAARRYYPSTPATMFTP